MPLLELKGITIDFPGVRALSGVSFDLRAGEIHALCGENGAGKSTLIKILCGIHPTKSHSGEVWLHDKRVSFKNLRQAEDNGIALIAQELALVPELTVAENMLLGREPTRLGLIQWDEVRAEAQRGLSMVGLDVDPDQKVRDLGIGQQQMVEIAKALLKKAEILVLDEPTAALTGRDAETLLSLMKGLRKSGVSCVYISHRLEEVFQIADRITVLRDGRSITTQATVDTSPPEIIRAMVGRVVESLYPRPEIPRAAVALEVGGWTLTDPARPDRPILRDINFSVREGEILGIAGLMGAGRTALVSSLFGAGRGHVSGVVRVKGRSSTHPFRSPREAIAAGIALVSEDRKRFGLYLDGTILDNMTLVTLADFQRRGLLDESKREAAAAHGIESLHIRTSGTAALAKQLSGGNQQKVVLAKWLMARPHVLLLDEPTRGIDIGAKSEIYQLVKQLAANGLAVVLVSSDLPEVLGMSHRVIVLNQGEATECLEQDVATPERVMAAATRKVGHQCGIG